MHIIKKDTRNYILYLEKTSHIVENVKEETRENTKQKHVFYLEIIYIIIIVTHQKIQLQMYKFKIQMNQDLINCMNHSSI